MVFLLLLLFSPHNLSWESLVLSLLLNSSGVCNTVQKKVLEEASRNRTRAWVKDRLEGSKGNRLGIKFTASNQRKKKKKELLGEKKEEGKGRGMSKTQTKIIKRQVGRRRQIEIAWWWSILPGVKKKAMKCRINHKYLGILPVYTSPKEQTEEKDNYLECVMKDRNKPWLKSKTFAFSCITIIPSSEIL